MTIEAMKLALEALEQWTTPHWAGAGVDKANAAHTALRTAIEQSEKQEPVACGNCNGSGRMVRDPDIGTDQECFVCDGAGVPAAPVQEKNNG